MMTASAMNPSHALLFLLLIFSLKLKTTISCPEIEKQSLLSFKQSLEDPDNELSSWEDEVNCCKWKGVVCNNLTGHVHQLRLRSSFQGLRGKVNPSLANLKHLRYLDLSQNDFEETIPSFIASFTNLEYLNLSNAGFLGKIPHVLGNLSQLHTLDLAGDPDTPVSYYNLYELSSDRLLWLSGLLELEYLNMNYADLSSATDWAQTINTLPSLVQLHLKSCFLEFEASLDHVNITSLRFIDLSQNSLMSLSVPTWIFELSDLVYLDLSINGIAGPIPRISNATKLHYINLSGNKMNSTIPDWIYSCKDLEFLSLGSNSLQGTIHDAIGNLTSLNVLDLGYTSLSGKLPRDIFSLCRLKLLDLSNNELHGELSENLSECFLHLEVLSLSRNQLSSAIPAGFGKLSALETLSLDGNKFTGNLPESFGQLSNLKEASIGDNMLKGVVSETYFINLTKLGRFDASGNHLTLKVATKWIPPFKLEILALRSWNLRSSQILSWLETQKETLSILDLSDAGLFGETPMWIWDTKFLFLNLSHNHLHGSVPYILSSYTFLSSNNFSGSLPLILGSIVQELDLLDNSFSGGLTRFLCNNTSPVYGLTTLHLGGNELGGELPDCWKEWKSLQYLNLGDNNIHGSIPTSFGYLPGLLSLNLYGNNLSSQIPFSLHNCTSLLMLDLSNNHLYGSIPAWIGANYLLKLKFLILRSNKFSGEIPSQIFNLSSLQILDLSHNTISGIIPSCVDNLTAMATKRSLGYGDGYSFWSDYLIERASIATKGRVLQYDTILDLVTSFDLSRNNLFGEIPKELTSLVELRTLNLSENHLTGSIPEKIGDMRQLESLDFSRNSLCGQIPSSITFISSLSYLNLSDNNLTGQIPEGTQLQGFNASSFIGNNLCGPPLSKCSRGSDQVSGQKEEDDESDESHEVEWLYVFVSSGYAVGVSIVVSVLVLNKPWREAYFELLKLMWDKLYVFVLVNWRRLSS